MIGEIGRCRPTLCNSLFPVQSLVRSGQYIVTYGHSFLAGNRASFAYCTNCVCYWHAGTLDRDGQSIIGILDTSRVYYARLNGR